MGDVARRIYRYGTWLMLVVIIGQFTAAGAGVFSTMADDASGAYILRYHTIAGPLAVLILSLVMIIAAFIGRLPWRMTGLAAAFIPLLFLQSLFIIPALYPRAFLRAAVVPGSQHFTFFMAFFCFGLAFMC